MQDIKRYKAEPEKPFNLEEYIEEEIQTLKNKTEKLYEKLNNHGVEFNRIENMYDFVHDCHASWKDQIEENIRKKYSKKCDKYVERLKEAINDGDKWFEISYRDDSSELKQGAVENFICDIKEKEYPVKVSNNWSRTQYSVTLK